MSIVRARFLLLLLPLSLLALACGASRQVAAPRPVVVIRPTPRPVSELYAADEALRDALSGPLELVGKGKWPGLNRLHACAFRNARVFVVNAYCTLTETQAFRVDVYSPTRGRVRIYAESRGAVSEHRRPEYFTFTAETEPVAAEAAGISPVALTMSFEELRAYDAQRYAAYLPACFGGTELEKKRNGCIDALKPRSREWAERNRVFLEHASEDWYRLVRDMRALSRKFGDDPK